MKDLREGPERRWIYLILKVDGLRDEVANDAELIHSVVYEQVELSSRNILSPNLNHEGGHKRKVKRQTAPKGDIPPK